MNETKLKGYKFWIFTDEDPGDNGDSVIMDVYVHNLAAAQKLVGLRYPNGAITHIDPMEQNDE